MSLESAIKELIPLWSGYNEADPSAGSSRKNEVISDDACLAIRSQGSQEVKILDDRGVFIRSPELPM
jgi:hypothetical protein